MICRAIKTFHQTTGRRAAGGEAAACGPERSRRRPPAAAPNGSGYPRERHGRCSVGNRTAGGLRRRAHLLPVAVRAAARPGLHLGGRGRPARRGQRRTGARAQPGFRGQLLVHLHRPGTARAAGAALRAGRPDRAEDLRRRDHRDGPAVHAGPVHPRALARVARHRADAAGRPRWPGARRRGLRRWPGRRAPVRRWGRSSPSPAPRTRPRTARSCSRSTAPGSASRS